MFGMVSPDISILFIFGEMSEKYSVMCEKYPVRIYSTRSERMSISLATTHLLLSLYTGVSSPWPIMYAHSFSR